MEVIFELIVRGIIVNFFGMNTRYHFFKLIGREKSKAYLSGELEKEDSVNQFSQSLLTMLVGLISFISFSFFAVYILYQLGVDF